MSEGQDYEGGEAENNEIGLGEALQEIRLIVKDAVDEVVNDPGIIRKTINDMPIRNRIRKRIRIRISRESEL